MKKLKLFLLILLAAFVLSPFFLSAHEDIMGKPPPAFEFFSEFPGAQTFTSSGTWYRPLGVERVLAIVVAGGGGGSTATGSAGNGGGGGEVAIEEVDVRGTTSETITVGTGGAGSGGGTNGGVDGIGSSFGALVTAAGGNLGLPPSTDRALSAGFGSGSGGMRGNLGGTANDVPSAGAFGLGGTCPGIAITDGGGGGGSYGVGGDGGSNTNAGDPGIHGGGGGGGGGAAAAGAGGDGIVIIIPLVSNDAVLTMLKYKSYMLARWISDIFSPG